MISTTITAGIIRRRFCLLPRRWRRCRIWLPRIVWLAATLAAYAAALANILGGRTGIVVALGFPAALWNITAGQNGFFTAALIGGTLVFVGTAAGACRHLSRPSHLQAAIRLVVSDRADRGSALADDHCVGGDGRGRARRARRGSPSAARVGRPSLQWMPIDKPRRARRRRRRLEPAAKLVRPHARAWRQRARWRGRVQAAAALAAAVGARLRYGAAARRSNSRPRPWRAGALLATPYLYMYDLVVLAVAVAFLLRFALEQRLCHVRGGRPWPPPACSF